MNDSGETRLPQPGRADSSRQASERLISGDREAQPSTAADPVSATDSPPQVLPDTYVPESPTVSHRHKIEYDVSQMEPWREFAVILYNDDVHEMGEVVKQLMIALECSLGLAQTLMLKTDRLGRATIAITDRPRAIKIAGVLRQIDLRVTIHQIN